MTIVKKVATEIFGLDPKVVPIDQYDVIEDSQATIGKEWIDALIFNTTLFVLICIYVLFQYEQQPHFHWRQVPNRAFSKIAAWVASWDFAFCLLPGTLARIIKQFYRTQVELHPLLMWGLRIRKHVGLLAIYFIFHHACIMLLLYNALYYNQMLEEERRRSEDYWRIEWAMFMAVVSTSLFMIVGIASLPSVALNMNRAQVQLVFGPVVWLGLVLGMLHVLFVGSDSWKEKNENAYAWAGDMPVSCLVGVLSFLLYHSQRFNSRLTLSFFAISARHPDGIPHPVARGGAKVCPNDDVGGTKASLAPRRQEARHCVSTRVCH